jgi:hypothetical protein
MTGQSPAEGGEIEERKRDGDMKIQYIQST